jgi:DNA-binding response OmpR family regulator
MPTAWLITKTNPQLAETFQTAGWETEVFAPHDLVPARQPRAYDPDLIVFEVAEEPLFDEFQELCRDKLAPILAIVPNWAWADRVGETGADAVMVAPVNPVELLWRGRRLVRASKIVRVGELKIDLIAQTVKRSGCVIRLSSIEFRLLACLAEHIGLAVNHDTILFEAFGGFPERGGTVEQVKTCVKRLRQKIEPDLHHPQYIISIRRVGYQLRNQAQWEAAVRES